MKKKIVAPGIYLRADGKYSYRPWVRGRRTERILRATTLRAALKEYKDASEETPESTIEKLSAIYLESGAPDKRGKPRQEDFVERERTRINNFLPFFGQCKPSEVGIKTCVDFKSWRCARLKRKNYGTGERTVDMELNTLSNVLNYAVLIEECNVNRIAHGRPRFRVKKLIRHCRECCPRSGDELHRIAAWLFDSYLGRSEATAWQMLFEALSGCRTREALALRWDAAPGKPGYIREGQWLYIDRAKQRDGEASDCIAISPELNTLLSAMRAWRNIRNVQSQWFFPSFRTETHLTNQCLAHALRDAAPVVLGSDRPITSHGMRAFFVTWQRVRGVSDSQIAEIIGHRSGGAALVWNVYGRKLPPWASSDFNPIPRSVEPVWARFLPWTGRTVVDDSLPQKPSGNVL